MAADPGGGFWTTNSLGQVVSHGGAPSYGSLPEVDRTSAIVAMAPTPDGGGYWLAASSGAVFPFGNAVNDGTAASSNLHSPIVAMSATPDGGGYWLAAGDGEVFSFGDARGHGSLGATSLSQPITGMTPTPDGGGYWLVASDGSVFSFGDAGFAGSIVAINPPRHIVAMAPTPDGGGYWLVASSGEVFTFGDAPNNGSLAGDSALAPSQGTTVTGFLVHPARPSYTLVESNGTAPTYAPSDSTSQPTTTTTTTSTTSPPVTPPPTIGSSILGVYGGGGNPSTVSNLAASLGAKPHYAMDFLDGTSWSTITQPTYPYKTWKGAGYTMIWGVDMLPNSYSPNSNPSAVGGSCYGLTQGATGAFDNYFATVGQNIVNAGFPVAVIRIGWEFNGGWFPWAAHGCASAFATYFAHIVTAMRSATGQKFTFEWNPTLGDQGAGDLASYYPGDAFVDYVGLDFYDVDWANYRGQPAEFQYEQTQPYGLNWLASFASQHTKPMVFPEWGLGWGTCSSGGQPISGSSQVCGGDDATFINESAAWFASHNVAEATFWDFGTSSVNGSNPKTLAALANNFG